MTIRHVGILAAAAIVPASAWAQEQPAAPPTEAPAAATPEKKAFLESCAARKFETVVQVPAADGGKRGKKVTLCGRVGQSDTDWATTLKDAAEKVEADAKMAPVVKQQIVTALQLEIGKIEAAATVAASPPVQATPANDALAGYSLLPAIPERPKPSPRPPLTAAEPAVDVRSGYSVLPPLPAPPKPAARASLTTAALPALKKPRLTVKCSFPGDRGGGEACIYVERDTVLTIRADEDLAAGTSLRFVRRGDDRGEIALEPMRAGQVRRAKLPPRVCSGVLTGKAEIEVVGRAGSGAGQVLDRLGPFSLRCGA